MKVKPCILDRKYIKIKDVLPGQTFMMKDGTEIWFKLYHLDSNNSAAMLSNGSVSEFKNEDLFLVFYTAVPSGG